MLLAFLVCLTTNLLSSSCAAWTEPYGPRRFLVPGPSFPSDTDAAHRDHQAFGEAVVRRRVRHEPSSSCGCSSCTDDDAASVATAFFRRRAPPHEDDAAHTVMTGAYVTTAPPPEAAAQFLFHQQQQQEEELQRLRRRRHRPAGDCACCGDALEGGVWTELEGRRYHPSCYRDRVRLHCAVCGEGVDGAWYATDPWGRVVHTRHGRTPQCASCQRFVLSEDASSDGGGTTYEDGRLVCNACVATAVLHTAQIRPATRRVVQTLQTRFLPPEDPWLQGQIHISLAPRDELTHKACATTSTTASTASALPGCAVPQQSNFHGLTTTTRITTALRTMPRKFTTMEHEITLLRGLPDLQFRGVLAHELLHVWLNEHGYQPPPAVMEGFCNLGSQAVYQTEREDPALAAVLLQQMETDPDPVYGDGYRHMKGLLERRGWSAVVHELAAFRTRASHS